jgi:hypothetical protein
MSWFSKIITAIQSTQLISNVASGSTTITSRPNTTLNNLNETIDNLGDRLEEIPFTFFDTYSNLYSSNVSNNVLIAAGNPVPTGYYGIAKDFNIFFGTVAGTVKLSIMDYNFANKKSDYQTGITTTNNGSGAAKLDETEVMCLLGQTAGAGTVGGFVTGVIKLKTGIIRHHNSVSGSIGT